MGLHVMKRRIYSVKVAIVGAWEAAGSSDNCDHHNLSLLTLRCSLLHDLPKENLLEILCDAMER